MWDKANEWEQFFHPETEEEKLHVEERERGLPQTFTPSLSVESLMGYAPALAIGSSSGAAQSAQVLQGLREVAGHANYVPEAVETVEHRAQKLAHTGSGGVVFFSNLEEKKAFVKTVKETPEEQQSPFVGMVRETVVSGRLEQGPEKAVREYIVERVVKGKHQAAAFMEPSVRDPLKLAANAHLQNSSYRSWDGAKFDAKLASLVAKGRPAGPAAAAKA